MTNGDKEKLCAKGPAPSGVRTPTPTNPLSTVGRLRPP